MTAGLRVISGSLKGRPIPFNVKKLHADVTPERVKEALFSMISSDIAGSSFLDLFSCSGQIAVEAVSRGAHSVYACERDARRAKATKELVDRFEIADALHFFMMNYKSFLHYLAENEIRCDFIFCDPPYVKEKGPAPFYGLLAREVLNAEVMTENSILIFQHFVHNVLQNEIKELSLVRQKTYGNTTLSFYQRI